MKKASFLLVLFTFFASILFAQTDGTLSVSTTTSSTGGNYAPKNIVAIWVEDNQGNFVKTLLAYAQTRKQHLNIWEASTTAAGSPYNTTDAISGATRTSHATRTCSWNGTDVNGILVADGTYRLRMELTDKNGTGNYSTFTFTKGTNPDNQTPANVPSFSSISINWEPVATGINDPDLAKKYMVIPNPTSGKFQVQGENILKVEVLNQAGAEMTTGSSLSIDITNQPEGIYFVKITTDKGIISKKLLKK